MGAEAGVTLTDGGALSYGTETERSFVDVGMVDAGVDRRGGDVHL